MHSFRDISFDNSDWICRMQLFSSSSYVFVYIICNMTAMNSTMSFTKNHIMTTSKTKRTLCSPVILNKYINRQTENPPNMLNVSKMSNYQLHTNWICITNYPMNIFLQLLNENERNDQKNYFDNSGFSWNMNIEHIRKTQRIKEKWIAPLIIFLTSKVLNHRH